ncbi:MAG: hypothetical protein JWO36_5577 [Myxococcales bacterium]|nr:hypothetical protein [Myxococcales bacterium]
MTRSRATIACVVLALAGTRQARADQIVATVTDDRPGLSYLWDGGALPFFWGALAAQEALSRYLTVRETPLGFSASEGGASPASWEVPSWTLTATGAAVGVAMIAGGDRSRWYHLKGLAETFAVGSVMTTLVKRTFGRHRPDWTPGSTDPSSNESFVSGHATNAFAIATYSALYLRYHVFDVWRRPGALPWWEGVAYAGILGGASAFAAERVIHHRHHVSDAAMGSVLGSAEAAVFFLYQQRRFRSRHEPAITITPVITETSASVRLEGTF